jgi:hypothetical protein
MRHAMMVSLCMRTDPGASRHSSAEASS